MFPLRLLSILLLLAVQTVLALEMTTLDYQYDEYQHPVVNTTLPKRTVVSTPSRGYASTSHRTFKHSVKTTRSTPLIRRRSTVEPLHSSSSRNSSSVASRLLFLVVDGILVVIIVAGVIAAWCFCKPFQSKKTKARQTKESASPTSSRKRKKKLKGGNGASSIGHKLSHKKHPKMSHMVSSAKLLPKVGKGTAISATAQTNRIGNLNRKPVSKFIGSTGHSLRSGPATHGPPSKMDPRFGTMSSTILLDVDIAAPTNSALDAPSLDGSQLSELSNLCSSGPPKHALGTSIERLSEQTRKTGKKTHKQAQNHKRHRG